MQNHVNINVSSHGGEGPWHLTFIYGHLDYEIRCKQWEIFGDYGRCLELPWLGVGDFNDIVSSLEKECSKERANKKLGSFRTFLDDSGLIDLETKGCKFTWDNHK